MRNDFNNNKKVVGTKETLKAIKKNQACKVFLAADIDEDLFKKIDDIVQQSNIPVEYIDSKLKLGRVCGVDVATASAALLK